MKIFVKNISKESYEATYNINKRLTRWDELMSREEFYKLFSNGRHRKRPSYKYEGDMKFFIFQFLGNMYNMDTWKH